MSVKVDKVTCLKRDAIEVTKPQASNKNKDIFAALALLSSDPLIILSQGENTKICGRSATYCSSMNTRERIQPLFYFIFWPDIVMSHVTFSSALSYFNSECTFIWDSKSVSFEFWIQRFNFQFYLCILCVFLQSSVTLTQTRIFFVVSSIF